MEEKGNSLGGSQLRGHKRKRSLSTANSEVEDIRENRKVLSGKERQKKWADKNKLAIKLKNLKQNIKLFNVKDSNPEFKKDINEKSQNKETKAEAKREEFD